MKRAIILLFLFFSSLHINSQWVSKLWGYSDGNSPVLNSKGLALTLDNNNYCYVTGYVYSEISGYNIILIKFTPNGDTVFTRTYSGTGNEEDKAFGIIVDQPGNIYITGQLSVSGRSTDLVLLKYDNNGNLLWARTFGATNDAREDKGKALALDNEGNIYVTGFCTGPDGFKDILVQKYNSGGSLLWTRMEDGDANKDSESNGIVLNNNNFIYVTGYTTSIYNENKLDAITLKYSSDGVLSWSNIFNGPGNYNDAANAIALANDNGVYITGYTTEGNDINNTSALLIKYDDNGNINWTQIYESGIPGSSDKAFGIVVDSDEMIYITGQAQNENNNLDYLTVKYGRWSKRTPRIEEKWVKMYNGAGNGNDFAYAISILHNGKIVVTGASWVLGFDYATIIMNKNTGVITESNTFNSSGNDNDIARDVKCSNSNRIYVTGYSELRVDSPGEPPAAMTTLSIVSEEENQYKIKVPVKFNLYQNFPNPFNPSTSIKFQIPDDGLVRLIVYDVMGREVDVIVNQRLESGIYSINYKNTKLASGVYFYQLITGEYKETKKMTLIK